MGLFMHDITNTQLSKLSYILEFGNHNRTRLYQLLVATEDEVFSRNTTYFTQIKQNNRVRNIDDELGIQEEHLE